MTWKLKLRERVITLAEAKGLQPDQAALDELLAQTQADLDALI